MWVFTPVWMDMKMKKNECAEASVCVAVNLFIHFSAYYKTWPTHADCYKIRLNFNDPQWGNLRVTAVVQKENSTQSICQLTVVRHAHVQALLEATVLAFVARLLVNSTVKIAVIVHQLQPDGASEEALRNTHMINAHICHRRLLFLCSTLQMLLRY